MLTSTRPSPKRVTPANGSPSSVGCSDVTQESRDRHRELAAAKRRVDQVAVVVVQRRRQLDGADDRRQQRFVSDGHRLAPCDGDDVAVA